MSKNTITLPKTIIADYNLIYGEETLFNANKKVIVDLNTGKIALSLSSREKMIIHGLYKDKKTKELPTRFISITVGKNNTSVPYPVEVGEDGSLEVNQETLQELIGWIKAFPDSFKETNEDVPSIMDTAAPEAKANTFVDTMIRRSFQ